MAQCTDPDPIVCIDLDADILSPGDRRYAGRLLPRDLDASVCETIAELLEAARASIACQDHPGIITHVGAAVDLMRARSGAAS